MNVEGEHVLSKRAVEYFAYVPDGMAAVGRLDAEAAGFDKLVGAARSVGDDVDLSAGVDGDQKADGEECERAGKGESVLHDGPSFRWK
jgi:hypothetical protein